MVCWCGFEIVSFGSVLCFVVEKYFFKIALKCISTSWYELLHCTTQKALQYNWHVSYLLLFASKVLWATWLQNVLQAIRFYILLTYV